jgi:pimeloyl-ACP methyl ester carboxylesterase
MSCKIFETRLGEIECGLVGQGIPVVFIHGGHANCHETLSHKGFDLEKFQLITPSRPGYGRTPLGNNKTPERAAALIMELVEQLSLEKVIVYGISAGGLTAISLAANFPDRVSKLILASAVTKKWLDEKGKIYQTAQRIFNPKMEKITWGAVRFFAKVFPGMIAKSFYPQFSHKPRQKLKKEDIQELLAAMKHYSSQSGFLNDIDQDINEGEVAKIQCPTLIVHSEYDNSVSLAHPQHANRLIEHSELAILQNEWGHLFWIGADSKKPIEKIKEFIKA